MMTQAFNSLEQGVIDEAEYMYCLKSRKQKQSIGIVLLCQNATIFKFYHALNTTMDNLRMDEKRGHLTCGNRLAIERQESFKKFASLEEELLLPSAQACWDPTRFLLA